MWLKNGKKVLSTLLQVILSIRIVQNIPLRHSRNCTCILFKIIDNEVVKYIPPETFDPVIRTKHKQIRTKNGCLVVGAVNIDPQLVSRTNHCLLFLFFKLSRD